MKSYRSHLRQRMSGPRTDARGSSWSRGEYPTPSAVRYGTGNNGDPHDGRGAYATAGRDSLDSWARKWSTPTSTEHKAEHSINPEWNNYRKGARLSTQTAYWPTTTVTDWKRSGYGERSREELAQGSTTSRHMGTTLTDAAVRGHGHPVPETSPGGRTGSPLADLDPRFAGALMGFPVGWLEESGSEDSKPLVTPSSPSASRSSGTSYENSRDADFEDEETTKRRRKMRLTPIDATKFDIRVLCTGSGDSADAGYVEGVPIDPPDENEGWKLIDLWVEHDTVQEKGEKGTVITKKTNPAYYQLWAREKTKAKGKRGRPKKKTATPPAANVEDGAAATKPAKPPKVTTPRERKPRPAKGASAAESTPEVATEEAPTTDTN